MSTLPNQVLAQEALQAEHEALQAALMMQHYQEKKVLEEEFANEEKLGMDFIFNQMKEQKAKVTVIFLL